MKTHPFPRKLHVELATMCNLGCAMCVKHSSGWECADAVMSRQTFEALAPVFPHLDTLNLNGVGESMLHPELPAFVAYARGKVRSDCVIGFQSNGMLLTPALAGDLVAAGLDRVCFSVDSPDPLEMGALRSGSLLDQVGQAFGLMRTAAAAAGRPLELGAQTVVSRDNLERLPDTVRWCAARGAQFAIVSHVLPYTQEDAGRSLYVQPSGRSLDLFLSWRDRLAAEGLDIRQFTSAFYAFVRTPAQRRLVDGVLAMLAEARARGFEISLPNMLKVDLDLMARVRDVFRAASDLAQSLGLRLDLPSVAAREPRKCAFVQDPTMFVACDGAITPCYFLWHGYTCWPDGERVQVRQMSFGSAGRDDALEVWNSPEFRQFRDHARREEFPRCGDCSLTPCDFVQGFPEPFVRDCYDVPVPCGVCPWSGGGFACLQ
jgi:putative metalloenzyme radical SAM/SPASM domain maturase